MNCACLWEGGISALQGRIKFTGPSEKASGEPFTVECAHRLFSSTVRGLHRQKRHAEVKA